MTPSVLVIDDDKLTRWSLGRILAGAGYRVREAKTAAEGMLRLQDLTPDLVFLDFHLPDADGPSLLQLLQDASPALPVVMMSADATMEAAGSACGLGARGFLAKPFRPALVLALAAALLEPTGGIEMRTTVIEEDPAAMGL